MKNLRPVCFYFSIFVFMLCSAKTLAQSQFKVMSFNIHHGANTDDAGTLDKMADLIKSSGADIVALQEVDSVCKRSGDVDQARYLGEKTGMFYAFVRHFSYDGGSYGQALLSRFPITSTQNERLPVYSGKPGTEVALLVSKIKISKKLDLNVAVAHLDYRNEASRLKQADTLYKVLDVYKGYLILMGDMNATPESETMLKLSEKFRMTHEPGQFTFPAKSPTKKIDYILIRKGKAFKNKDAQVLANESSDHRAISSVLALK